MSTIDQVTATDIASTCESGGISTFCSQVQLTTLLMTFGFSFDTVDDATFSLSELTTAAINNRTQS